jgi:hypothetical protein
MHPPPLFPTLFMHLRDDPGQGREEGQEEGERSELAAGVGTIAEGAGGHRWWTRWEATETCWEKGTGGA